MKHGIQTCTEPIDPKSIYMRNMYHEFFWGPFSCTLDVIDAINTLDIEDPYWDYEPFCIIYGANPLPSDFLGGFPAVEDSVRDMIFAARRRKCI